MIRWLAVPAILLLAISHVACVPWTVRPIDSDESATASAGAVTPASYVNSLWSAKLLPAIENSAVDARSFLDAYAKSPSDALARWGRRDAGGPVYLSIKGEGRVLTVDTKSKVGLAMVDVAPFDGKPDVTIQIGPVLRGTSLRDATGLVRFTDFVNQLQFADVANELNDRVLKTVLSPRVLASLGGKVVAFAGTAGAQPDSATPIRELVPVRLAIQESR
jgi:predicted lipoprotein